MSSQETTIEPVKTDVSIEHVDNVKSDLERADRFGSIAKVDPREIALARKLDLRLMVGLPSAQYEKAYTDDDNESSRSFGSCTS